MTRFTFFKALFQTRLIPEQLRPAPMPSVLVTDQAGVVRFLPLADTEFGISPTGQLIVKDRVVLQTRYRLVMPLKLGPKQSLVALYRNGLIQTLGVDFGLSDGAYDFLPSAGVTPTDLLTALVEETIS